MKTILSKNIPNNAVNAFDVYVPYLVLSSLLSSSELEDCLSLPLSGNGSNIFGWILIRTVSTALYSITSLLFLFLEI